MFQFFKYLLWITLVIFFFYLLALVVSYIIGPVAFGDFKAHILPYGFFLPFVIIICFLGMNYFREEDWLDNAGSAKLKPVPFYSLLLLNFAAAVAVYLLFVKKDYHVQSNELVAHRDTTEKADRPYPLNNDTLAQIADPELPKQGEEKELQIDEPKEEVKPDKQIIPIQVKPGTSGESKPATEKTEKKGSSEIAYTVMSKAYFYEQPDESTKREVFVENSTSPLPLKPREERNGFVYVIVPSKQGISTFGWLRKKDLRRVEVVLNDSKQ